MTIKFKEKPATDKLILSELDPLVRKWFKQKFGKFSKPQKYGILPIHQGKNILVSAPTGSGKTLLAFLSILNELIVLAKRDELEDRIYALYASPLKALSRDIEINLKEPLEEMEEIHRESLGIRIAVRTGDTSQYERQKMLKNPPHILITTPETLGIVLVAPKFKKKMMDIKWVIIDEIHALAPNKRGVHLSLSLERLQNLAGPYIRIGLSATVAPLEEMAKYLVGYEKGKLRDCLIVDVQFTKELDLKVLSPVKNIISASQDEMQESLYELMDDLIQKHRTTLVFTNTRSATERVVHHLKTKFPKKYVENIGAHHSSLSKEHRLEIEQKLRDGELKSVVCSTSLELGIDIGYIDLVILLGSPKSVARALQRVGRSGHQLHDKIKGRFIVMDRDDLVECAVMLKDAVEKKIDRIKIPKNALDVLSQQIYGIAIGNQQHIETVYDLVKRSYCYHDLEREEFMSVIDYLAGEYVSLEDRNVYAKIWHNKEKGLIGKRGRLARAIYSTNIGTIPDESYLTVKQKDEPIGKVEEAFLERIKKGDIFVLGGKTYRFNYARGMTIQVTPQPNKVPTVPSWFSEMLPLSYDLALEIQKFRRKMEEQFKAENSEKEVKKFINDYLYLNEYAVNSIYQYFKEQYLYAEIPHDKKLVIEFYHGFSDKKYVIFHSLYGRRTNDALSRAIAYLISNVKRKNIAINLTDNGFYLTTNSGKLQVLQALKKLKSNTLRSTLRKAVEKTEILRRRFRHCAGRSLMILRNYKGRKKSAGKQQVSSKILLSAVRRISKDFPILKEARREVLEDLMDVKNAEKVLKKLEKEKIEVKIIATDVPSPFALNLIARGYMDILKMEDRLEFVRRLHKTILERIEPYETD
ncbi:MAG: ATP-dependent helicase [Candidatus Undinarchaeales archaeon]